ncbi:uncharacterized protein AC631_03929 [Debaryomyces fabryi]|uniref:Major facilitator superfamily (MFS) profile domain-containing protein n=1 Tax=Debaryomyces fabryi TaxID=58627 RepID=A0A0V1PVP8_9ASCO|nr:uncharacterized protein AC631_03929 [Debaryomyces fabryi]KSA00315.1 hypothetical protein AC631_03929 [Debaryomyces fabryi]CUM56269.1 unnamed protein product [Debaryomyces fabryi]
MSVPTDNQNKEANAALESASSSFITPVDRDGNSEDQLGQEPEAFTGDLENGKDEGIPRGGDELSRYESNSEASRTLSHRLTGAGSLISRANDTDEPLPPMGGGKDYPPPLGSRDPYVVSFNGPDDPIHPHNWPQIKKIFTCMVVGLTALSVSLGSAMFAEANQDLKTIYHIGTSVAALGVSLFVLGFAAGPIIWGPLSELYGRKIVMVPSCLGYVCFSFAVATGKDIQTIMICRFFAGFIGAAPLVVVPASIADMYGAAQRGQAMALFAMVLFGGPMMAPIFGGFTVKNDALGWRWTSYFSGLVGALALIGVVFFYEETHHPLILVKKAETLRRRTGNWGIQAPHDEVSLSLKEICENNVTRPIVMLFREPILLLISIYNAFIYGLLYLFLTAVPLIFIGQYHFVQGVGELPYLSMLIGIIIGGLVCIYFDRRYTRIMEANGGKPVPEERLPAMMIGSFFFSAGLFWLGWAGDYADKVHWIVPTIGAAPIGFGLIVIFLPSINYIIDCYLFLAASALAANTFLRSAFAAAFPLFAQQMFVNMEIKWASTLLGCFAAVLIPVPFLFYRYGARIRAKSKYAFVL